MDSLNFLSNLLFAYSEGESQPPVLNLDHYLLQINNKLDVLEEQQEKTAKKLEERKHETENEIFHLHNTLNACNSKLDSTKSQLDQVNHKLNKIQDDITNIRGPYTCGGTGGWRRVVYLDVTDPSTTCPSGWKLTGHSKRTCGRATDGTNTCDSVTFPVTGGEYSRVCGRIRAYQYATTDGFWHQGQVTNNINGAYVDGVSVTHGTPRNHKWTFAAGLSEGNPTWYICPCDASIAISVPSFVGEDYFCESGVNRAWDGSRDNILHSNDALWDGKDCLPSSTCCSLHNPPYFVKQLPTSTTDDIEARICLDEPNSSEHIAVELVDLYVQ